MLTNLNTFDLSLMILINVKDRDRTSDLQIFSLTLSQLSYFDLFYNKIYFLSILIYKCLIKDT